MKTPEHERQLLLWRTLGAVMNQPLTGADTVSADICTRESLPIDLLENTRSIESVIERHPELADDFAEVGQREGTPDPRSILVFSKMLVNVFGPNASAPNITASALQQWTSDLKQMEQSFGHSPGDLRYCRNLDPEDVPLGREIQALEQDLVKRMALREILEDDQLAAQLDPSIGVVEQLLRDKANLSDHALRNAKSLIRRYVDQLADVMRTAVARTPAGKPDRSLPPKRVFRNLDLKRTLWKNLPNYHPEDGRLYVSQLFYKRNVRKIAPKRMIVVVDQSGSMVEAMVQCTILASIFAGLRHVDVHLMAFDTRVIDLTAYVQDPFEVLLRTQLGGGTLIKFALDQAELKIEDPPNTVMVLISDFYEGASDQELLDKILFIRSLGAAFIPVGAITGAGAISIHPWFRTKLQEAGMPILSGKIEKLIGILKANL